LRSKVMALLAVVAGAASYTLVRGYAAELESLRPTAGDTVQVVVADRDLERGSVIDDGSVRVERMPSAFAPPGALRTTGDAIGRTLGSGLAEGEAVTRTRIGEPAGRWPPSSREACGRSSWVRGSPRVCSNPATAST
jgi:Flp pilus assembly protein CpaB